MAGSFAGGYVGTSEDVARIRRQEKQRGDARKKFEVLKKESDDRVDGAGLRQFGVSTSEVGWMARNAQHVSLMDVCIRSASASPPARSPSQFASHPLSGTINCDFSVRMARITHCR